MTTLDLHGVKHQDVEILVEDFVLENHAPLEIITGNSNAMKKLVVDVLVRHDFKYMDGDLWNRGKIIVL
jgi:hypothetical protein